MCVALVEIVVLGCEELLKNIITPETLLINCYQ